MSEEPEAAPADRALVSVERADSWERLSGETNPAWNAFCAYRDYGADRSIKKVLELHAIPASRYGIWCAWSARYQWVKRAGDYDVYTDKLKRTERDRRYAEREKLNREITEKVLSIVSKRLESFDPEELSQSSIMEWIRSSIEIEKEIYGKEGGGESSLCRQLEINFTEEFKGI